MMDRRVFIAGSLVWLAAPLIARAQREGKVYRVGYLSLRKGPGPGEETFLQALRELGYVEGRNLVIEYRWAGENFDRLSELAAELVRLRVDVLVTHAQAGARAAQQATTTVPIVLAIAGDVAGTGLVSSLARPGGNLTGSTALTPELSAKRLALLKEAVPRIRKVAVLKRRDDPAAAPVLRLMESAAKSLNVTLQPFEVRGPNEFVSAFLAMAAAQIEAVEVFEEPILLFNAKAVAELTAKHRLPSTGFRELAEEGGLIGYGVDVLEAYRRAAIFVDKIFKGAKAGDLPIEQPTKFELIINLKTAQALGLTIPQALLLRADEIIQ